MSDNNQKNNNGGLMEKIITAIENTKDKHKHERWISTKTGWNHFIDKNEYSHIVGSFNNLIAIYDNALEKNPEHKPKGTSLLQLRKAMGFTVNNEKIARPEEALERYIVKSNEDMNIYNQIPIGGYKEDIDLGFGNEKKFTFIELKPWNSDNNPLFALTESLKNFLHFNKIQNRRNNEYKKNIFQKRNENDHDVISQTVSTIDLIILAPNEYYKSYRLMKDDGQLNNKNIWNLKCVIQEIMPFYQNVISNISYRSLIILKEEFENLVIPKEKENKFEPEKPISTLKYQNWRTVLEVGKF